MVLFLQVVFLFTFSQMKMCKWNYCGKNRTYFTSISRGRVVLASLTVYDWYKLYIILDLVAKLCEYKANIDYSHANAKFCICALLAQFKKILQNFAHAWYFNLHITKLISLGLEVIIFSNARLKQSRSQSKSKTYLTFTKCMYV